MRRSVNEQLNHALNSRIVIEQAKGMLVERTGLDMEQAFDRLRNHARNHNLRLVDVARDVISGALPAGTLDPPRTPQGRSVGVASKREASRDCTEVSARDDRGCFGRRRRFRRATRGGDGCTLPPGTTKSRSCRRLSAGAAFRERCSRPW